MHPGRALGLEPDQDTGFMSNEHFAETNHYAVTAPMISTSTRYPHTMTISAFAN